GDLTLAAYASALQVVTAYSSIDRQPLDRDLYRKLAKNEITMLRDLVDYAAQVANGILVPEGFPERYVAEPRCGRTLLRPDARHGSQGFGKGRRFPKFCAQLRLWRLRRSHGVHHRQRCRTGRCVRPERPHAIRRGLLGH